MNTEKKKGIITRVSGPLVEAKGLIAPKMYEVVRVGDAELMGEIIELKGDISSIQVYEETAGIGPGEPVYGTGGTMSVDLGPGLLESIYDGIQRPLKTIEEKSGSCYIARGIEVDGIDRDRTWDITAVAKVGDLVSGGDILGEVQETSLIMHKVMVPPGISGKVKEVKSGSFNVTETIAVIETFEGDLDIPMLQKWPIRVPRPKQTKIFPSEPLITGGRSIDTFFPVAKGGAVAIPGPFGSGKTVTQQSLAKYCDAQVIVYVGCGERGNEMTEVLNEFPELIDPNTGEALMKRTILIANTSNMPVAAREASVYSGITIAEYYRDMGYSVALMADSTSRWAEAMREISGRMEEMPGEEGYPAYLSSRTAEFYERAGVVKCLGTEDRTGALTVIGAVSPPGGDLSEPVSQATLRVTKCFWGLDSALAYKKHFPTINWLTSYSLYVPNLEAYWRKEIAEDFPEVRASALTLLQAEAKLLEIVKLVGMESLSNTEKLTLEVSRMIREDFLFQNAFDKDDSYTPPMKQYRILKSIMSILTIGKEVVSRDEFEYSDFAKLEILKEVPKLKDISPDDMGAYDTFDAKVSESITGLVAVTK
ncbi:V-type ATP synthase subunit A [Candidatus Wolfebacteria bacterium]|nr:MAG: V-type ATP synthase subunit A [Candidatus Wolfebacteria bacterium]